ncbi:Zn-dependent hydrolase [Labrys miyagiensis]|uniref:Zn-dependent hydrolase n=1 Tax=Labrys miyagiensis TaxID=346912 RepID=A0ABQ6CIH4_9HYPH|nr:Zn-dependent hydrolase [Labrys miyagiensis]GLS19725.1 Zn-dependent hydrolase [Labrys miyagiensis]
MPEDRLWQDLMALAEITDPAKSYTRRCFTDRFLEGRRWLERRFAEAGLTTRLDEGGNLIGRLEGGVSGLKALAIGSHSDTVPSGGRFDGPLGLLAGLEVVRLLKDRDVALRHPLEIIDFLSEEPSDYGPSCIGSRAMTGFLDAGMLGLRNPAGEPLQEAMTRMGALPERLTAPLRNDVAAFLELHIEQARVLEQGGLDIGLVTGIVGIARVEIEFTGSADHAGTTPFHLRQDALVAAADLILQARRLGEHFSRTRNGYFIATTGRIEVHPNASNVVPGLARLMVEARAEQAAHLDAFLEELALASLAAASAAGVERSAFRPISRSEPSPCDGRLRDHLAAAAGELSLKTISLASGAGHDAGFMGRIAPMAMIFVPSREGRSHCPEEWTEPAQCAAGARVLYEAVRRIDGDIAFG